MGETAGAVRFIFNTYICITNIQLQQNKIRMKNTAIKVFFEWSQPTLHTKINFLYTVKYCEPLEIHFTIVLLRNTAIVYTFEPAFQQKLERGDRI